MKTWHWLALGLGVWFLVSESHVFSDGTLAADRKLFADEVTKTDALIAERMKIGKAIPAEIVFDYVAFRKDWDAVNTDRISRAELDAMRVRFRVLIEAIAKYTA